MIVRERDAFFGREDELAQLSEIQETSVSEKQLRVTLISGEPGIGKTTLVAQAARAIHGTGANVLYGHCQEDLGVPYQPWSEALSQLIEQSDEALLRQFVDANGTALARLVPARIWLLTSESDRIRSHVGPGTDAGIVNRGADSSRKQQLGWLQKPVSSSSGGGGGDRNQHRVASAA